jgi:hypothetical protein
MMIMGDNENDPRRKKDVKKEDEDMNSLANYTGQPGINFLLNP